MPIVPLLLETTYALRQVLHWSLSVSCIMKSALENVDLVRQVCRSGLPPWCHARIGTPWENPRMGGFILPYTELVDVHRLTGAQPLACA